MKTKKLFNKVFMFCAVAFFMLFCVFQSVFVTANAEESTVTYSDVMTDLQKDESFSAESYPAVADDYSMQVIQIAESVDKELFIYVYQPSAGAVDLTATTIRLSMPVIGVNAEFHDYDLTLLSSSGVLSKFKVEELTVKNDVVRYYDITALHRLWNADIDEVPSINTEQMISEVFCEVSALWKAETVGNTVVYSCTKSETIEVVAKVVGFVRYSNGFSLKSDSCDSHFVAFTTDRQIDDLQAARVGYKWRTKRSYSNFEGFGIKTGEWQKDEAYLEASNVVIQDGGWFGKKYEWNRIEKVSTFLEKESEDLNLTSGAKTDLYNLASSENTSWVLRFYETDYDKEVVANLNHYDENSIQVSDVTIIQLTFWTDGDFYNLGVLDNKQTGPENPLGNASTLLDEFLEGFTNVFAEIITWILGIALLALLVIVLLNFAPAIISLLLKGVGFILKHTWAILLLPIKLLKKLFKRE